ncbi:hypothetical protein OG738_38140 [Amycolatopsis sp. NBC_01488]|uniref:glycosyl hydrolase family 28-related protein n=1 Tax=Amycolatopsis sp. NBC_01488 TaxID=2903563 RepID=UPI002E2AF28B|nr:glycosyl hydrolase family 28-related protein [Amycolatopsis sp. NBC_01488]
MTRSSGSQPAPTVVESYSTAQLPAAGTRGRLAQVTDSNARLWLDDGKRWSPLLDNVVNVLSFGAVSSVAATTATMQAALDSRADVYLPAGAYHVDQPLRFYSGQTVFGDGKSVTQIITAEPIIVFQSADYPMYTRDVRFRDLLINNTAQAYGVPGSIGIDFTGVSFSQIERVSMRGHEIGIRGRDTALRTWVRKKPTTATRLLVTATDTLYTGGEHVTVEYPGDNGEKTDLTGEVTSVAPHDDADYPALDVAWDGNVTATSVPVGALVRRTLPPSGAGGYYVSVLDCEIATCGRGISLTNSGNNWTVLDGRVAQNITGVHVEAAVGNRISSAFEKNGLGIEFGPGADANTVIDGCYFEANGNLKFWHEQPVMPPVLGAVRCRPGAIDNTIEPGLFSNGEDTVVDEGDARNTYSGAHLQRFPSIVSGHSNGQNILFNGDFEVPSADENVADGWFRSTTAPAGTVLGIEDGSKDPATLPAGAKAAQRWVLGDGRNDLFFLYRDVAVIPGQWYTFTAQTRATPRTAPPCTAC